MLYELQGTLNGRESVISGLLFCREMLTTGSGQQCMHSYHTSRRKQNTPQKGRLVPLALTHFGLGWMGRSYPLWRVFDYGHTDNGILVLLLSDPL